MNIEDFDSTIARVATSCGVSKLSVEITYSIDDECEVAGPAWNWTVRVGVIRPRARQYKTLMLGDSGETLDEAADSVIDQVVDAVRRGEYKTPNPIPAGIRTRSERRASEGRIDALIRMHEYAGNTITRAEAEATLDAKDPT